VYRFYSLDAIREERESKTSTDLHMHLVCTEGVLSRNVGRFGCILTARCIFGCIKLPNKEIFYDLQSLKRP
jgi:hypothetical protein